MIKMDKTHKQIPVGIILILTLTAGGIISLIYSLIKQRSQFGPFLLTGFGAIILNLIVIAVLGVIFYGILKRFNWARKLTIGWYVLSMIMTLTNLMSFMANKSKYVIYYSKNLPAEMTTSIIELSITISLIMALIIGWIIGIAIITYLLKKKDYFNK